KLLEETNHMFWLATELRPQFRLLRRNTRRTGIQVTLPSHIAAERHEHRCAKGKLVSPKQCRDQNIASRGQTAIGAQTHTSAHAVLHQHLLRLCKSEFPRIACVLDARKRRSTSSASVSGDHNIVCVSLGNARSHGSNTATGDQLHTDCSLRINPLEVVDQLRK